MCDYIDRDAFRQELINTPFYPRCETTPDMLTTIQDRLNDTIELLDNIPAAEVRPVKEGKWDNGRCTACGKKWDEEMQSHADDWGYFDPMPPFCLNCGAYMGGDA